MSNSRKNTFRLAVDAGMSLTLLGLMGYQVTGEALHEWLWACGIFWQTEFPIISSSGTRLPSSTRILPVSSSFWKTSRN